MKRLPAIALIAGMSAIAASVAAAPVVYNNEAAFRAAAGLATTYGFENHGVVEGAELAFSSPLSAAQLDGNFDLAYANFNGFQIVDNAAATGVADGSHYLFTHSSGAASDYSLVFSNFGGANASVTAFGFTITDFASNINDNNPVTIAYSAGGPAGILLSILGGQPDFTQNFVGLTVDAVDAFSSISITLNDNLSGFQDFDEVIYSQVAAIPEPGTFALVLLAVAALAWQRRKLPRVSNAMPRSVLR